jgi:polyribonucleotide nucleotidyltransferase
LKVLTDTIAEPRSEVAEVAPKIVTMEIPIDKIGEVIGPKGKVINTLQQETGADIAVDGDGVVGTVTIGAKDGRAVEEARRRISLILDPPSADVGAVYQGRVVSIAKFGAFINILPGRDGLLHISKLAPLNGGKRIGQVEDVLELGQALEVKVDDIDPQGKVSLSLVGDFPDVVEEPRRERSDRSDRPSRERSDRPERESRERSERPAAASPSSSFEASFEAELAGEIGDLGPGGPTFSDGDGGGRRSPRPRRR